jgi:cupin 2 domain-containing protein
MNLYDPTIPETGETFTTLLEHKNMRIVRIVSSDTLTPTEYIQDEDEWVVLIEGEATLEMAGKSVNLQRGESLFIPARTPHTVRQTARGTVWLAVHIYTEETKGAPFIQS